MPAPLDFSQKVNHALTHLYDPDVLRKHPLLELLGLSGQPNAQGLLRETLMRAIEELKPSPRIPIESRAWRVYKILHMRYVQQMDQEQTAHQIGVGVRHLRREQTTAVNALADVLYQKYAASIDAAGNSIQSSESALGPVDEPVSQADPLEEEFAWLQRGETGEAAVLSELVPAAIQLVSPLAAAKGIAFENRLTDTLPEVLIFPAALRQALISMTTYAIHRLISGRITFDAVPAEQTIELILSATSEQPLAPDTSKSQDSLKSIQRLLGAHAAGLTTETSTAGFTFRLSLPVRRSILVLMIDDNQDVIDLFQRYVYATDYVLQTPPHLEDIFSFCEQIKPQVILLDIMIPQVDGWELLGRIQQHPSTQSIPIVVCSALPEGDLAIALGADAYLHKPVARADLLAALREVTG
jgi:CheY-like chemotaxis protein